MSDHALPHDSRTAAPVPADQTGQDLSADVRRLAAALTDPADLAALERLSAAVEQAEAREFDAREAEARAETEVARVAGQVAHDLNNPLAAVAMCLEIARDQVDDSEALLVSLLERAAGSAARMKRMTADLLDHAREPSAGTTDLQAELEALMEALGDLVPGEVRLHDDLPTVPGAPEDLRVVLVALLENAAKFAREGVPVEIDVRARREDGSWRVEFSDNGRGIAPEDRDRVLEPTVRLDKRVPGLGMGLATVSRIVRAHGGRAGVEESASGGTTVWFALPVLAGS